MKDNQKTLISEPKEASPPFLTSNSKTIENEIVTKKAVTYTKSAHKIFSSIHHSKFRHLHGSAVHRSKYIENVRNLNTSTLNECDGFQCNSKRAALPIEGPGGKIAIVEVCLCITTLHLNRNIKKN